MRSRAPLPGIVLAETCIVNENHQPRALRHSKVERIATACLGCAGASGGIGAMNDKDNVALVPRSPTALERAEPGARHILSGMVADTLALAKKELPRKSRPLRIVQVNNETSMNEAFDIVIRDRFPDATVLSFDNAVAALEELSQTNPDLLITDDMMAGMCGSELCQRLLERKVGYPIIVDSSWESTEQWVREYASRGLNIKFLSTPFDVATFQNLVAASLNMPSDKNHEQ